MPPQPSLASTKTVSHEETAEQDEGKTAYRLGGGAQLDASEAAY